MQIFPVLWNRVICYGCICAIIRGTQMEITYTILLSSMGTTAAAGAILFLSKNWLITRLTKSIQHEYDKKFAEIESRLRVREAEISDIRQAAISNAMISQNALDERRLKAIDDLWRGVLEARKYELASEFMSHLKIEEVSKGINEPNAKEFVDAVAKMSGVDKVLDDAEDRKRAQLSRPWIGQEIWVVYSAYTSLVYYPILVFKALQTGGKDPLKFIKTDNIYQETKKALPNLDVDWDNLHYAVIPRMLELLKDRLLMEIECVVSGEVADKEIHDRIASMSRNIEKMNEAANKELS